MSPVVKGLLGILGAVVAGVVVAYATGQGRFAAQPSPQAPATVTVPAPVPAATPTVSAPPAPTPPSQQPSETSVVSLGIRHAIAPNGANIAVEMPGQMVGQTDKSLDFGQAVVVKGKPLTRGGTQFVRITQPHVGLVELSSLVVNIYAAPSASSDVVGTADYNGVVEVISRAPGWIQITEPAQGWISTE